MISKYKMYFSENRFALPNSVDPENAALCGYSSGSPQFAKVPILGFLVYKGFKVLVFSILSFGEIIFLVYCQKL